jgi:hypothetical protein
VLLAFIGVLLIGYRPGLEAQSQVASPFPASMQQAWDSLLQGTAQEQPDAILTPRQVDVPGRGSDIENHFFFEGRSQYWRYNTRFTGQPTVTGIINAPTALIFNPSGFPYPQVFQPDADRASAIADFGTRGWILDRVNTHFTVRYAQDLTHVNSGAPAENLFETYRLNKRFEFLDAFIEVAAKPSDGALSGASLRFGRLSVNGAELAQVDGGSFTLDRPRFTFTAFAGRRFSYYSNPDQRRMGGANITLKLTPGTTLEYEGLWYIRGSNSATFRHSFSRAWLWNTHFRAYGGSPVDFSTQVMYSGGNGKTSIGATYFQKLTNKDYFYDYTYDARDLATHNSTLKLYLGPLSQYSQISVDARRSLTQRVNLGGALSVRRLNDSNDQGPFDTSFDDYRLHTQLFLLPKTESFFEYHQRNSDRLSPLNPAAFDDVSHSGETRVRDVTGELRRGFGDGRFNLHGGVYYRRVSLQDQFFIITGEHQSGWLAGAWWRVDQRTKLSVDYSLDNDFFLFTPDLRNSRILQLGLTWRY